MEETFETNFLENKPIEKKPILYTIYKVTLFSGTFNDRSIGIEELEVTKESPKKVYCENQYHHPIKKGDIDKIGTSPFYFRLKDKKEVFLKVQAILEKYIRLKEQERDL